MNREVLIVVLALAALYSNCGIPVAGGSSQQGNGIVVGRVISAEGTPSKGAHVYVRPTDYVSSPESTTGIGGEFDAVTDDAGCFSVSGILPGRYTVEANDRVSSAALIEQVVDERSDTVNVGVVDLAPYARITGFVSGAGQSIPLYVQVRGLERLVTVESDGAFTIADLPEGTFDLRLTAADTSIVPAELSGVDATAGTAVTVSIAAGWRYSRMLRLNTTASGADVAGDVIDFPVLIRLTENNFDFSRANGDGSDVRFTKADTTFLPCEIERWDGANRRAELWVMVDTVHGDDSAQSLMMHWGNPDAVDMLNPTLPFDTALGFQGVWHLDGNGDGVSDVTANEYDGRKRGNTVECGGAVGMAQYLDGSRDYIDMGNVCDPDAGSFTINAWIKKIGVNKIQTIASKSTGGSAAVSYGWLLQLDSDGALGIFAATGEGSWGDVGTFVLTSNVWITDSAWHHVAAVLDRSGLDSCRVFIDGRDVSSFPTAGGIANLGSIVNDAPLRFGADANGNNAWEGALDEISISFRARSPEYVRLCYMNRKSEDELVNW